MPQIREESFGKVGNESVTRYTLSNSRGMEVQVINFGGIVTSINVPDNKGQFADVALGFNDLQSYRGEHPYFGAIIGRYGNRIANGKFGLDGQEYTLAVNNGPNHLHGGLVGFDKRVWKAAIVREGRALQLTYVSPHMEEGYPGELTVDVTYSVSESNELVIEYRATSDRPTVLNLTNHSYFNLAGEGNGDVLKHLVMIDSDAFTAVDASVIPTGELRKVEGTPFDFRSETAIGARIDADDEQIRLGSGYDHNYVLKQDPGGAPRLAARVLEGQSGRVMEVFTTEPGVQFYTGNFLDGTLLGKSGKVYQRRSGFCLETQHYPNSPNKPEFPTTVLRPGETYNSTTIYKFSTRD